MPKTDRDYDRPTDDNKVDCYVCRRLPSVCNIYHPIKVKDQERGTIISSCRACYISYKALKDPFGNLKLIIEKLRSRNRYTSSKIKGNKRWHMDLQLNYMEYGNEIVYAEDTLTGERYDLEDVQKFVDKRDWLFEQPLNIVDSWCQEHLTDQRFINKIVTTFSS